MVEYIYDEREVCQNICDPMTSASRPILESCMFLIKLVRLCCSLSLVLKKKKIFPWEEVHCTRRLHCFLSGKDALKSPCCWWIKECCVGLIGLVCYFLLDYFSSSEHNFIMCPKWFHWQHWVSQETAAWVTGDTARRKCKDKFGIWHCGQRKYKVKLHSDTLEVKYVLKYFAVLEPVLSRFVGVAARNSCDDCDATAL